MATLDQIVTYIKQYKDKFPMETLKGQLLKQGVAADDIEEAVKLVQNAPEIKVIPDPFSDEMAAEQRDFTTGGMPVIPPRQPGGSVDLAGAAEPVNPRQPPPTEASFNRPITSAEADFSERTAPPPKHDGPGILLLRFAFIAAVVIITPKYLEAAKLEKTLASHLTLGAGLGAASGVVLALLNKALGRG